MSDTNYPVFMEKRRGSRDNNNNGSQQINMPPAAKEITMNDKIQIESNEGPKSNASGIKAEEQKPHVVQRKSHLEPGPYHAEISNATFFVNAEEGYEVIGMQMEVFDDSGNRDSLEKFYNLTTKGSVLFMRGELHKIGILVEERKDFSKAPEKLKGLEVDITLNFNDKGFPVIYFVRLRNGGKKRFDPDSVWN